MFELKSIFTSKITDWSNKCCILRKVNYIVKMKKD